VAPYPNILLLEVEASDKESIFSSNVCVYKGNVLVHVPPCQGGGGEVQSLCQSCERVQYEFMLVSPQIYLIVLFEGREC
jgi:hypothetical protein